MYDVHISANGTGESTAYVKGIKKYELNHNKKNKEKEIMKKKKKWGQWPIREYQIQWSVVVGRRHAMIANITLYYLLDQDYQDDSSFFIVIISFADVVLGLGLGLLFFPPNSLRGRVIWKWGNARVIAIFRLRPAWRIFDFGIIYSLMNERRRGSSEWL